jgi:hypothetical protein
MVEDTYLSAYEMEDLCRTKSLHSSLLTEVYSQREGGWAFWVLVSQYRKMNFTDNEG